MEQLQELANGDLLKYLSDLRSKERIDLVEFLMYVGEIDARRLWAEMACSSMHVYLTTRLGYSDPTASKRVKVARAGRRYPVLFEVIFEGRLHLTGACILCDHLNDANQRELIEWACGKSKLEIEMKVAEMVPRAKIDPKIRKLPRRKERNPKSNSSQQGASSQSTNASNAPSVATNAPRLRSTTEPVDKERWRVTFDLEGEELELLKEASALVGEKDARRLILLVLSKFVAQKRRTKFGETEEPRTESSGAKNATTSRHIPNSVRREVVNRDGRQCSYCDASGQRCCETSRLEFHHVEPWAKGGKSTADNVVLLCNAHNAWFARRDYGDKRIEAIARSSEGRGPGSIRWRFVETLTEFGASDI